jgi:hypothetical protein
LLDAAGSVASMATKLPTFEVGVMVQVLEQEQEQEHEQGLEQEQVLEQGQEQVLEQEADVRSANVEAIERPVRGQRERHADTSQHQP